MELKPRRIGYERAPGGKGGGKGGSKTASWGKKAGAGRLVAPHLQNCVVQVAYTKSGSVGKWYSHGAYIARESPEGVGFTKTDERIPVAKTVARWRRDGDELFFRVILSPEQGNRLDLEKLVRETMTQMERDLQTRLTWVAVAHHNTDRPHIHVMIRGKRDDGRELRIPPRYIQEGLRDRAAEAATRQLGYRTREDLLATQQREICQARFTGLDRQLLQRAGESREVEVNPAAGIPESYLAQRLVALERMGLALRSHTRWRLHQELERSLRTAQKTRDRVQMMEAHGVLVSDPNLPFRMVSLPQMHSLEGRVLVHGQDEYSGNNFSLLETITGEMVRIPQTKEMVRFRQKGGVRPGSYVRIERRTADHLEIEDRGDAEAVLRDRAFLRANARRFVETIPSQVGGWLGRLREVSHKVIQRATERGR